jgi:hypothetical protein
MKTNSQSERQALLQILRHDEDVTDVMPGFQTHEHLWEITRKLPDDYKPYGQAKREGVGDCSGSCRWYHILAGRQGQDWGICANPASHRVGLLTFEHQGCHQYEYDSRVDEFDRVMHEEPRVRLGDEDDNVVP